MRLGASRKFNKLGKDRVSAWHLFRRLNELLQHSPESMGILPGAVKTRNYSSAGSHVPVKCLSTSRRCQEATLLRDPLKSSLSLMGFEGCHSRLICVTQFNVVPFGLQAQKLRILFQNLEYTKIRF